MNPIPKAIARAKTIADGLAAPRFEAKAKGDVAELYIYDAIGGGMFSEGVTPAAVQKALAEVKGAKELRVYINSPGGDVFDGVNIYNQVRRFNGTKNVFVDGIAASAASMIAMAGDTITIAHNAQIMIHRAWGAAVGTADDMRATADLLDKISEDAVLASYARTGQSVEQLRAWMTEEKWMNAAEAVELGFADRIDGADEQPTRAAAQVSPIVQALETTRARIDASRRVSDRLADEIVADDMRALRERIARRACSSGPNPACGASKSSTPPAAEEHTK